MTWAAKTRALVAKELVIELRARDTFPPMLAFSAVVVVLLSFVLPGGTVAAADVLAGFFWVTVLFAGLIAFARTFESERDGSALEALILVPVDRSAIFVSKSLANLVIVSMAELVLLPPFAVLFGLRIEHWGALGGVVALTNLGFVAVGTLFSAIAAGARSRELLLPVLALPVLVPLFIAAVELTSDLFGGVAISTVASRGWFAILVAFDVILLTVGVVTFEYVLE